MIDLKYAKYICFSGGGVRGAAFVGSLMALKSRGINMEDLKGASGTSIGGLFALFCVL